MILGRNLASNALRYPERAAIIDEHGVALSHRAFAERTWRIADGLARHGLGKNSRVAILAGNCPDYLSVHHALACLGAWTVPINTALKLVDIELRLAHAEVQALFISPEFAAFLADLGADTRRRIGRRVFAIGGSAPDCVPVDELIAQGRPTAPDVQLSPEDILYVGYTSGTTGTPKGALISHRGVVGGFLYKALAYGLSDRDVTLNPGPFWHSAPRDFAALAVYLGGTVVVPVRFKVEHYLALVERYRVTNSFLVPTMLQRLVHSPALATRDTSSLRCLISGGAPLPTTVKERALAAFGPILTEFYGATETRIVTIIAAAELAARDRSVGRPVHDVELRVLNAMGREVAANTVGEIFIRAILRLLARSRAHAGGPPRRMVQPWRHGPP